MTDPASVMAKLDQYAAELDELSKGLTVTERKLEPLQAFVDEAQEDFDVSCWEAHRDKGDKLPSEAVRIALARKGMPTAILSEHSTLLAKRKRLQRRIKDLADCIDAQRSILSALKEEMAATR